MKRAGWILKTVYVKHLLNFSDFSIFSGSDQFVKKMLSLSSADCSTIHMSGEGNYKFW